MNPTWEQVREWIRERIAISPSGCWVWTLPSSASGYGRIWGTMAHRLSYMAHVGPIGSGLDIDHLCRNRACVNPAHLEPVTRKENLSRGIGISLQKERAQARTHCTRGHELNEANIYVRPSDGVRECRKCNYLTEIEYRNKNKDKINSRKREWRRAWKLRGVRK